MGSGNPGAIGISHAAHNTSTVSHITIRSSDPARAGAYGLGLNRAWPGPNLFQDIKIEGFDIGIMVDHWEYSITFDRIELEHQNKLGIRNTKNAVALHHERSRNKAPLYEGGGR
ncbi:MAG: hypothetical protein HC904_08900 [Blastochloris sp.]|nr:hypothetical protein [Blastochloris sp.]